MFQPALAEHLGDRSALERDVAVELGKPDAASVIVPMPFVVWLRPVIRHERVGEHSAVVWKFVYRRPRSAIRLMFGVSIRPPNGSIAEKPTSSSTM